MQLSDSKPLKTMLSGIKLKLKIIYMVLLVADLTLGIAAIFLDILVWLALVASFICGMFCLIMAIKYRKQGKEFDKVKLRQKYGQISEKILDRMMRKTNVFSGGSLCLSLIDIICTTVLVIAIGINSGVLILTALGNAALLTTVSTKVLRIKKYYSITKIITGGIIMKNTLLTKIKNVFKYIFKSNPITIGGVFSSIALLIANGATDNLIGSNLFSWLDAESMGSTAFNVIVGALAFLAAGFAGLETNKKADARKLAIAQEKEEERINKEAQRIALEKFQQEKEAEDKRIQEQELLRIQILCEQAKRELKEKNIIDEQNIVGINAQEINNNDAVLQSDNLQQNDMLGFLTEDNIYVITSLNGHPKQCDVNPKTLKEGYMQAKQYGAQGFAAITPNGKFGYNEMQDSFYNLGSEFCQKVV